MRFSAIAAFSFLPLVSLPGSIAKPDNMDDEVVLLAFRQPQLVAHPPLPDHLVDEEDNNGDPEGDP